MFGELRQCGHAGGTPVTAKPGSGLPAVVARMLPYRRPVVVGLHLLVIVIANRLAFALRFDDPLPPEQFLNFVTMLPWLLVIRGFIFLPCGLYAGMWRYTGIWDLRNIIVASLLSTGVFVAGTRWGLGLSRLSTLRVHHRHAHPHHAARWPASHPPGVPAIPPC